MLAAAGRRAVLELAGREGSAFLELPEDVAAKGCVLLEELVPALVPDAGARAPVPPHQRAQERQRLDRPDVCVPLDQLALAPQQPVELAAVVRRPEAAPEDEVLRGRDRRDRVELQEPEPSNGRQDSAGGAGEKLRANGDSPRLLESDRRRDGLQAKGSCQTQPRRRCEQQAQRPPE
jgi:hypothetical protein